MNQSLRRANAVEIAMDDDRVTLAVDEYVQCVNRHLPRTCRYTIFRESGIARDGRHRDPLVSGSGHRDVVVATIEFALGQSTERADRA